MVLSQETKISLKMSGVYIDFLGKRETVSGEKYISFATLEMEVEKYKGENLKTHKKKKFLCFRSRNSTYSYFRRSRWGKHNKD